MRCSSARDGSYFIRCPAWHSKQELTTPVAATASGMHPSSNGHWICLPARRASPACSRMGEAWSARSATCVTQYEREFLCLSNHNRPVVKELLRRAGSSEEIAGRQRVIGPKRFNSAPIYVGRRI